MIEVIPTEIILTPFRRPSHRWIFQDAPQIMQLVPQFHLLRLLALLRCGSHLQILPRSRRHVRWVGTFLFRRNRNEVGGSGSALTAFHDGITRERRGLGSTHLDDPGHLVSEFPSDLFDVRIRILDGVVQDGRLKGRQMGHAVGREDVCHSLTI
jgi:hypothetical protein